MVVSDAPYLSHFEKVEGAKKRVDQLPIMLFDEPRRLISRFETLTIVQSDVSFRLS